MYICTYKCICLYIHIYVCIYIHLSTHLLLPQSDEALSLPDRLRQGGILGPRKVGCVDR